MPLIEVKAESVDIAWQLALARVLKYGDDIKTEYDNPDDPPSKDATVAIEITDAFSFPMQRKFKGKVSIVEVKSRAGNKWRVYGSIADTYLAGSINSNYIEEVLEGINDHFLWKSGKSFPYSYHDRLFNYRPFALEDVEYSHHDVKTHNFDAIEKHQKLKVDLKGEHILWEYRANEMVSMNKGQDVLFDPVYKQKMGLDGNIPIEFIDFPPYNQIDPIIAKLKASPYSRRCQATTWRPIADQNRPDPPCMQRIWCRIINGKLKFQTTWRSRDLYRAWQANVNGMLYLQKYIAEEIGCDLDSYTDFSNSLHIYGSNFKEMLEVLERMSDRGDIHPELEAEIKPLRIIVDKYFPPDKEKSKKIGD